MTTLDQLMTLADALGAKFPELLASCPAEGGLRTAFADDHIEQMRSRINQVLDQHVRFPAYLEMDDA